MDHGGLPNGVAAHTDISAGMATEVIGSDDSQPIVDPGITIEIRYVRVSYDRGAIAEPAVAYKPAIHASSPPGVEAFMRCQGDPP
jgi:hypothetical protein